MLGFALSPLIYGLLAHMLASNPQRERVAAPSPSLYPGLLALGAAELIYAVLTMRSLMRPVNAAAERGGAGSEALPSPQAFQSKSIAAAAIAVSASVVGILYFFLGSKPADYIPFAVGTLLVMALYIIPQGLKYWSVMERYGGAPDGKL